MMTVGKFSLEQLGGSSEPLEAAGVYWGRSYLLESKTCVVA